MARQIAATFDYRCPFARNAHEHILTGQAGSKVGMQPEAALALAERMPVAGLHMHIGSQLRSLDPYRRAVAALARVGEFEVYDLGGIQDWTDDDLPVDES